MHSKPDISIIIPCFNAEKYISKCLDSVINQTYKNIEIIVVNDGSKDSSPFICDKYAAIDSRINVIHKENGGLSDARNTGVKASNGEFLMFVDSDDWINPNTCKMVLDSAREHNADVVMWSYIREYPEESIPKHIYNKDIVFGKDVPIHNLYRRFFGLTSNELNAPETIDALVTACIKLYRSEIIKNNNIEFVDCKIIGTEDVLYNIYVFRNVKKAIFLAKNLYHYRKTNSSSLTSCYKPQLLEQWTILFSMMEEEIIKQNLGSDFKDALSNRIALSIVGLGLNILSANCGHFTKIKMINEVLNTPLHKSAYKQLSIKHMPIYWKVFFLFAKRNFAVAVYFLLKIMDRLRRKI